MGGFFATLRISAAGSNARYTPQLDKKFPQVIGVVRYAPHRADFASLLVAYRRHRIVMPEQLVRAANQKDFHGSGKEDTTGGNASG